MGVEDRTKVKVVYAMRTHRSRIVVVDSEDR